jgi:hypothetical protein
MCLLLTPLVPSLSAQMFYRLSHTRTEPFLFGPVSLTASRQHQTDHHLYDHWCKTRCKGKCKGTPILFLPARPHHLTFLFTSCPHSLLSDDFTTSISMNTTPTIRQSYAFPLHLVLVSSFCTDNFYFPFGCTASLFAPISHHCLSRYNSFVYLPSFSLKRASS